MASLEEALPVAARAAYGALLVAAPGRLLAVGAPGNVPGWAAPTVRVLGARHLLQAAVLAARPGLARPGALVDLAHAATDVLCAFTVPALRGPALLDTGIASGLAACASLVSRQA